jgi:hypothetical protein
MVGRAPRELNRAPTPLGGIEASSALLAADTLVPLAEAIASTPKIVAD